MQMDMWSVIAIMIVVVGFFGGIWYEHRQEERKMGIVEFIIIGLVFVALAGCFVYSLIANKQK